MLDAPSRIQTRLADLVASRLCHDLVNPLGAIGNGVELLEMTGKADGPEMELIRDAVRAAEARIRLFRLAFGAAGPDQDSSRREAAQAVDGYFHQSRVAARWDIEGDRSRLDTKIAFLMLLCGEATLPMGGELKAYQGPDGVWTVEARGARMNIKEDLWQLLKDPDQLLQSNLRPGDAHFAVLAHTVRAAGRVLDYEVTEGLLSITVN